MQWGKHVNFASCQSKMAFTVYTIVYQKFMCITPIRNIVKPTELFTGWSSACIGLWKYKIGLLEKCAAACYTSCVLGPYTRGYFLGRYTGSIITIG